MTLTRLARVLVVALNGYFWVARKTVRASFLKQDKSLIDQVLRLEANAYTQAGIKGSIEGTKYFEELLLGLKMLDFVHLGIRDMEGNLLAYMSVLQPVLSQWGGDSPDNPGEFVFPVCYKGWLNNGSPNLPVFIYRKVLRDPNASKLLYQTGAWRLLLGLATMLISMWQRKGWLMVTQAQADTMRMLKKHLGVAFPDIGWWVEHEKEENVKILLIHFPIFTYADMRLMVRRVSKFAKMNKFSRSKKK